MGSSNWAFMSRLIDIGDWQFGDARFQLYLEH